MNAFLLSIVALVAITALAVFGLDMVPMGAEDVHTVHQNVRL
jgi:uncharacterized protein (UPF0210 family)